MARDPQYPPKFSRVTVTLIDGVGDPEGDGIMSAQLELYVLGASRFGKIDACTGYAPAPASCRAIQQNDEMHCAICGLRWDVNDGDPPKCRRALRCAFSP